MTRFFWLCSLALSALATTCAPSLAQNLLVNGDLSSPVAGIGPPTGWSLATDPSAPDLAILVNFADHTTPADDSNRGLWFRSFFGGQNGSPPVDADLTQSVPATPGATYQFSGWALFETHYPGGVDVLDPASPSGAVPSPTDTIFAMDFFGASPSPLASASLELKADGQTNNNAWKKHVLSAVAPPGTTSVVVRASLVDGVFNVNPMMTAFVDDFSLTAVPEPAGGTMIPTGVGAALALARRRRASQR